MGLALAATKAVHFIFMVCEEVGLSFATRNVLLLLTLGILGLSLAAPACSQEGKSLLAAGPNVRAYAVNVAKPALDSLPDQGRLAVLLKLCRLLQDPQKGIGVNALEPKDFFIYDLLDELKLGFFYAWNLPSEKRRVLRRWHDLYMQENRADFFFAPSADEIIRSRAAFGCSHYARSFIAVAKALGLIEDPADLRYVVSCKADDYNRALEKQDFAQTINGHQFVLVRIGLEWFAINTSKGKSLAMPRGFSPESYGPPQNTPIRFESYPGVVFLIRKIGADYNEDCGDDSLSALMNISRSGDPQDPDFLWERYSFGERN